MANVTLDNSGNITGIFVQPQPQLSGFTVIDDTDARIATFQNAGANLSAARAALDASDITVLRCVENSVTVPPEWAAFRAALRNIVSGRSTSPVPATPSYPAGT